MEGILKNSRDGVVVRFGAERITVEERNQIERAKLRLARLESDKDLCNLIWFKKERLKLKKNIAKDTKSKELPIQEFLKLDSSLLSKKEQQVQRVLSFLYKQNESETPIYKKFPDREIPIVIDCTTISHEHTLGVYSHSINSILVGNYTDRDEKLVSTLAHELKHAEHWIDMQAENYNAYQIHQLLFLKEAQANACGDWVLRRYEKTHIKEKIPQTPEEKLWVSLLGNNENLADEILGSMASEDMPYHLNRFLSNDVYACAYKDDYDLRYPILYTDKGLIRIPSVFGIEKKDEVKVLKILNTYIPKKARTPDARVVQACKNNDIRTIKKLLSQKDENGSFLVSDDIVTQLTIFECYKNAAMYDAVLKANRLTKDDKIDLIRSIFHFSEQEECSESELKERKKVFKKIAFEKDEKGCFVVSKEDMMEEIYFAEAMEEKGSDDILKYAKMVLKKRESSQVQKSKDDYSL